MCQLEPPYPLICEKLHQGCVIPFLGAGVSVGQHNPNNEKWEKELSDYPPNSNELAGHLAYKIKFPLDESRELARVAQFFHFIAGRESLHQELHGIFAQEYQLTSLHTFLAELPTPLLIVTTNYDNRIERACRMKGRAYDVVIHTTDPTLCDRLLWWPHGILKPQFVIPNKLYINLKSRTVVYKMHGSVDHHDPKRDQYVITEDDSIEFLARMTKNKAIPAIFAEPFQTRHFLFLCHSLRDWNLRVVLNRIEKDLRRSKGIKSWAIQDKPSLLETRFWRERGVEVYDKPIEEFIKELKSCRI
jgi:hypothetical protein